MEIEEQNAMNYLEIRRRYMEIALWRRSEEGMAMLEASDGKRRIPDEV
jgi:hypothetical protein